MLGQYRVNGETMDSLDLKVLLVTKGVKVSAQVYETFGRTSRLDPEPQTCNCLLLPDGTVAHVVDLAMHMAYIKKALSSEMLRNLRYMFQLRTPFSLEVADSGHPVLLWKGEEVTRVTFPPASRFYRAEDLQWVALPGQCRAASARFPVLPVPLAMPVRPGGTRLPILLFRRAV